MSGQQDSSGFHAGRDLTNSGIMSGRDTNITIKNRVTKWALANPALAVSLCAALVVSGVWGGATVLGGGDGSVVDTSVVSQEGLTGARSTLDQIRVAERVADTAAWCEIAQPSDGTCVTTMSSALTAKAESYREQVDDVGLGEPEKTDGGARMQLRWKGQDQGYVSLAWTGGRWQLASTDYGLFKLCGAGVFLSLVDARNQQAKCGPFSLPTTS